MRRIVHLLGTFSIFLSLAGCSNSSDVVLDMYINSIDFQNWVSYEDISQNGLVENKYVDECNRLLEEKGYDFQVAFHYKENRPIDSGKSDYYQNLLLNEYADTYSDTEADIVPVYRTDEDQCLNLDSYLEDHDEFYNSLPAIAWMTCMQNGSVFAVPHSHNYIEQSAYLVSDELNLETGKDYKEVFSAIQSFGQSIQSMYLPIQSSSLMFSNFDSDQYLLNANFPCLSVVYDNKWRISPYYENEEVLGFYKSAQALIKDGYTEVGLTDEEALEKQANGTLVQPTTFYPGFEDDSVQEGYHLVPFQNVKLSTGVSYAILKNSSHPDEAFTFLELLNTDTDFIDLFLYGLEDVDYKIKDGVVEGVSAEWIAPGKNGTSTFVNPRKATEFSGLKEAFEKQDEQYKTVKIDPIQFAIHALDIREFSSHLDLVNFMLFQYPTHDGKDPMEELKESFEQMEAEQKLDKLESKLNELAQEYEKLLAEFYQSK